MDNFHTVQVEDTLYDEIYTAHIEKNGVAWKGWIPELPTVLCEANSQEELIPLLEQKIHETLVMEDEVWEEKIAGDIKEGHLDNLREKAREDLRTGNCVDL